MAPTATDCNNSPTSSVPETTENNLQPVFVLHKASSLQKLEKKSSASGKTRRRTDMSPTSPKHRSTVEDDRNEESSDCQFVNLGKPRRRIDLCPASPKSAAATEDNNMKEGIDSQFVNGRIEIFVNVWSKMESTIKDILRDVNAKVFEEINQWVRESCYAIKSFGIPTFSDATRTVPIVIDGTSKQLFTGLVLTKNMEFVDDLLTFEELGQHLTSLGCHVANLSSLDFSVKNGVGGCLRSLLRQFLMVSVEATDISVLATWYREQGNHDKPVVLIIDDMERCCGSVLSDFILMLSEWVLKIPVILIMGIATTIEAPRNILPSHVLHHLCLCKFVMGTPFERMDAIVQAVLVNPCFGFKIGHKVAMFLRNYFLSQDGTITSFIRALKIACAQHLMEPRSFVLFPFLLEKDDEVSKSEKYQLSLKMMLMHASDLPSYEGTNVAEKTGEILFPGISELRKLQKYWSIAVQCLYEAGKYEKIRLIDLFCEALDPQLYKTRNSYTLKTSEISKVSANHYYVLQQSSSSQKENFIYKACRKVRDLSVLQLTELLNAWEQHTVDIPEMNDKVKDLLSKLKLVDGKNLKKDLVEKSRRHTVRGNSYVENSGTANVKVAALLESMVRDYMRPIECVPLHEIVCFKNVDKLQAALIGDPRRRIQIDLLEFHKIIKCGCCSRSENPLSPSMPDASILYILAHEHGDVINLHDWYQSFKMANSSLTDKPKKQRPKNYPHLPKKRKSKAEPAKPSEASIQARFCRAVAELQITGLIRMPTKRRPDFVQRIAFGL